MKRFMKPQSLVFFRVPSGGSTIRGESLWAQDLGKGRYRIFNCPFFVYGVSLHDIVLAPHVRGRPTFKRVLSKSGNRTIRIAFDRPAKEGSSSARILEKIVAFGCGYEGADYLHFAVNVPARARLSDICDYLNAQGVMWEHADPILEDGGRARGRST